jgi:putative phosphoesterase
MKKILVVSDNHGHSSKLNNVRYMHQDVDYKVHCGDSEFKRDYLDDFIAVRGNNDFNGGFPVYEIINNVEGHTILVIHGDGYVFMDHREPLVEMARDFNADIVFFGHTHVFEDLKIDGIRLINPGSLAHNRDRTSTCYAIVTIDKNDIKVQRIDV